MDNGDNIAMAIRKGDPLKQNLTKPLDATKQWRSWQNYKSNILVIN